ncbi:MAG: TlpA family protein disulfide reductase [Flavobacteriaceae bacterium]|nr:TlpA family protein disulfide reductase [Flavobacteriaceae bacterium]
MKAILMIRSAMQVLLCSCLTISGWSQSTSNKESSAKEAWEELDSIKNYFGTPDKGLSIFERRRHNDQIASKKSKLAASFLRDYPDDPHYDEVLDMYFHRTFTPDFIEDQISDSLLTEINRVSVQYRASKTREEKAEIYSKFNRVVPVDHQAMEEWLRFGRSLAASKSNSDAPMSKKMGIELKVFYRDLELALKYYQGLYKDPTEENYWERFDLHYWETFRLTMTELLNKYSNEESMATTVQRFIGYVSNYAPSIQEPYWAHFMEITESGKTLSDQSAFTALHEIAKKNLAALEVLKKRDPDDPLQLEVTDMGGNIIDLEDFRGKVVLLVFWSIRCPYSIKEMPQVAEMYKKYRDKGFEIIGIAEEGEAAREHVMDITEKADATWPQVLDKGTTATVSHHALFQISSYPTVWLLDKEGKIVDKHARGKRLEPLIREHLGLEPLKFNYRNPFEPNND